MIVLKGVTGYVRLPILQKNRRKCRQNLWKSLEISSKKLFRTNFWEFPGNYSQDFLKSSSGISWNTLSIFLSKFTNQDLGPRVVNNLTTILPLQLFRSITIFSVGMYSRFWSYWIVKKKKWRNKFSKYFFKKMVLK